MSAVVVDTGPLVAMLRRDDQNHAACLAAAQELQPPLWTTWLVITEAAWLLRNVSGGVESLLRLIESDLVRCYELEPQVVPWLQRFLNQYADLSPQLADGSIVYAAEMLGTDVIFTLDRRDFVVFRGQRGQPFRLLPE